MKIINSLLALALAAAPASAAADGVAAKVNGEPILISEYNKTKQAILEQYRAMMPDFLKQKGAEEQLATMAMDKLVDELLLTQQAEKLKIKVYDRELENGVAEIKKRFARDEAGRPVSPEMAEAAFRAELAREGVSAAQFRERIRKQLMVRKLIEEKIRPQVSAPSEKEVRDYYDKIQLAVKGATASLKGMDKDDIDELKAVAQRFKEVTAERVRLRHILVKVAEGAPLAEKNKAREKALALKKLGIKVTVLGEKEMRRLGMGALLGVGQGSARESKMVIMEWTGVAKSKAAKAQQPVAFVGKGVTFDTGGISIKPAEGMEAMKWDMGGAGAVAGALKALALRKAKVNVVGVCGLVENM
ncbi:MAG: SurA N-terminal domain-containing protein, partial [Elusimicrobiales bacterium]|nr:SurA N-terminal domain-containing protein [Elusimicrobiales bacterium]